MMAFSSRRGRPRQTARERTDPGTPELRLKHSLGLTSEPIDRCLEKGIINAAQHRSGLHYRWLYTLRYGAPCLTTRYEQANHLKSDDTDTQWRSEREQEYLHARQLLHDHRLHTPVERLCIHNEVPAFLSPALVRESWQRPALADGLAARQQQLVHGLELLTLHWQQR